MNSVVSKKAKILLKVPQLDHAKIKDVHVFLIVLDGGVSRYRKSLDSMLKLFGRIFSDHFWKNTVIEVTKYSFNDHDILSRKPETEESWKNKRIAEMEKRLPEALKDVELKFVFIDSWYDRVPTDTQWEKFKDYTDELWNFAENVEPMTMKTIKVALREIDDLYDAISSCQDGFKDFKKKIEDSKAKSEASVSSGIVVLVAIICFVGGLLGFSLCQKFAGRKATDNEEANENINMVVEDSLDEKNSSNDDNDLEAGTKFDATQETKVAEAILEKDNPNAQEKSTDKSHIDPTYD
jgi:hypothetical protein